MYISSADIMTRNQTHRVEIGCPVYDKDIKDFISEYVNLLINDNVKSRILLPDGTYVKPIVTDSSKIIDAQRYYIDNPPVIAAPEEEKHSFMEVLKNFFSH